MSNELIDAKHIEAQGGLLQAALKDNKFRALVLSKFGETDFYGADRELYRIVKDNSPFVPDKLSAEANTRLLALEGTLRTLPSGEDVQKWIAYLQNTSALATHQRNLLTALAGIKPGADAAALSKQIVSDSARVAGGITTQTTFTMDNIVDTGLALFDQWKLGHSAAGLCPTGIEVLDRRLGGLVPGHVTTLGGGSSQAKTTLALQIMRNVALRSKAEGRDQIAVFLSLDMGAAALGFRLASAASGVNWQDVRNQVPNARSEAWVTALKALRPLPLTIKKIPSPSPADLMYECELEAAGRRDGLSLVVVDFIELMRGEGSNETSQVGDIAKGLKVVAERYGCPVLALSQISREAMKSPARIPEKFHLRQSGMIENISQTIMLCYYPAGYQTRIQAREDRWPNNELQKQNDALNEQGANFLVKVEKHRDDESGYGVPLLFEPTYTRFDSPNTASLVRMKRDGAERAKAA